MKTLIWEEHMGTFREGKTITKSIFIYHTPDQITL